ncbi:hypothetical protein AX14_013609 [Amanita brunnescens Koide BX004]|nr:hypothetical protein AX14_013609 [Amanita brunnescens Koide BX004]
MGRLPTTNHSQSRTRIFSSFDRSYSPPSSPIHMDVLVGSFRNCSLRICVLPQDCHPSLQARLSPTFSESLTCLSTRIPSPLRHFPLPLTTQHFIPQPLSGSFIRRSPRATSHNLVFVRNAVRITGRPPTHLNSYRLSPRIVIQSSPPSIPTSVRLLFTPFTAFRLQLTFTPPCVMNYITYEPFPYIPILLFAPINPLFAILMTMTDFTVENLPISPTTSSAGCFPWMIPGVHLHLPIIVALRGS